MVLLNDILARRRGHKLFDEELWTFVDRVQGGRLSNLPGDALQSRLDQIERNIQYLDGATSPRDELPPERGWISPWWWLRLRYWTLLEFERRGLTPTPTTLLPARPALARGFGGHMNSEDRVLVRISSKRWLLETLRDGTIRFAPAASYDDARLNAARADEEMGKAYKRPGQQLTVTTADGKSIPVLGDATFTTRRLIERSSGMEELPYWLSSFSTELDPRLLDEFPGDPPEEDGCLVIFDPDAFMGRALPSLNRAAPYAVKSLVQNDYFDPYYPDSDHHSPLSKKDFRYAYQREMRFILDPEDGAPLAGGGALFVSIGSIADIAAVYEKTDKKSKARVPTASWLDLAHCNRSAH